MQRKAHILLIGGSGERSGVPRHLEFLTEALCEEAMLTVCTDLDEGGYSFLQDRSGIQWKVIRGLKTSLNPLRGLSAVLKIRRLIRQGDFDLVWAHSRMAVLYLRVLVRVSFLPDCVTYAVTYHGLPFTRGRSRRSRKIAVWLERFLSSGGHRVIPIFLTGGQMRAWSRATRCAAEGVVLGNCSRIQPKPARADMPNIVMTSRHSPQKNLLWAREIFKHLPAAFTMDLWGAGTQAPDLAAAFTARLDRGAMERLDFHGPTQDIAEALARGACFVLTSHYEGQPIAALEAMEAGLPIATPRIVGMGEILDRHPLAATLSLQDAKADAEAVARVTLAYLSDKEMWNAKIRQAWQGNFSYEAWAPQAREVTFGRLMPHVSED
ncbi:glycosyltransferase [uncultured Celeribacter sp.]|uniref:glycosyltransferase n=1 Tax=uncultured Celeribacter sp. TaxID=1303376 RepID=UPI002AA6398C|nr:glycosyltransferase [uncultured Celeribacter sp.]